MPICNGNGCCISQEYGIYDYDTDKCQYKCAPVQCPNFAICGSSCPMVILSSYGNMCPNCHRGVRPNT